MRFILFVAILFSANESHAKRVSAVEEVKRKSESDIRAIIDPLLTKYCPDQCKLLGVDAEVEVATPDEFLPGFSDRTLSNEIDLKPASAKVKILVDTMLGNGTRDNFINLMKKNLEGLNYLVGIDTTSAKFPQPATSARKFAELRERVSRQYKEAVNELIGQVCPENCIMADFEINAEPVNTEEAQYASPGEFFQDGDFAIKVNRVSSTLLMNDVLAGEEQRNIIEMAKLKTNFLKYADVKSKVMKFPKTSSGVSIGSLMDPNGYNSSSSSSKNDTTNNNSENTDRKFASTEDKKTSNTEFKNSNEHHNTARQERFERFEKIERVENGDAVQSELQKFKVYGLIFSCAILLLLIFIAIAGARGSRSESKSGVSRIFQSLTSDPVSTSAPSTYKSGGDSGSGSDKGAIIAKRYEIERLKEELSTIFAEQPKVAKHVFSRILTEEGMEITAQYIHMFGESVVIDMLKDPSLQGDLQELMEYYAKNPTEIADDDALELLRHLHNRTVAAKMVVMGSRASSLFDFLVEMDALQVVELVRNESLTVKAVVLTQVDHQRRNAIYQHLEEDVKMKLLTELTRIDHLPRDYIHNVSSALKRKRVENPRLNTEALPGSDVLVTLLEKSNSETQKSVVHSLGSVNPDSVRTIKSKLVSLETLKYLQDNQLLDLVLSLKHEELLTFLRGTSDEIRGVVFSKAPTNLVEELQEELANFPAPNREAYMAVERKALNRIKVMATDGHINLIETNERMFGENTALYKAAG
ncbi:MAG: hypothetical protein KA715_12850 [Xanthomonadaceae bacterium]|nr:hypothetical protein [Xanthomonadaceae bacterium]